MLSYPFKYKTCVHKKCIELGIVLRGETKDIILGNFLFFFASLIKFIIYRITLQAVKYMLDLLFSLIEEIFCR